MKTIKTIGRIYGAYVDVVSAVFDDLRENLRVLGAIVLNLAEGAVMIAPIVAPFVAVFFLAYSLKVQYQLTQQGFERHFGVSIETNWLLTGEVAPAVARVQAAVSEKLAKDGRACATVRLEDVGRRQDCWRLYEEKLCPIPWSSGTACDLLERGEWLAKGYGYAVPERLVYGGRI